MPKHTLEFISSSDIVNYFVPQQNIEQFYSDWCDHWTWGNTLHSLVGNIEFLFTLQSFLAWLDIGVDPAKVEEEYWSMLSTHTFIDLET